MRPDRAWCGACSPASAWTCSTPTWRPGRTATWRSACRGPIAGAGTHAWDLPLSVAQHSLLVLVLRQQMQPHAPLDRDDALRELLHDGHEGFLSFDPISPVKPHLGPDFEDVANRLQAAIGRRYGLPGLEGRRPRAAQAG